MLRTELVSAATSDTDLPRRIANTARKHMAYALGALEQADARSGGKLLAGVSDEALYDELVLATLRLLTTELALKRDLAEHVELLDGRLFVARTSLHIAVAPSAKAPMILPHPAFDEPLRSEWVQCLTEPIAEFSREELPLELLGNVYEELIAYHIEHGAARSISGGPKRKQSGSFFTPRALTEVVSRQGLETLRARLEHSASEGAEAVLALRVCDPAAGGGAFLLEVARKLAEHCQQTSTLTPLECRRAVALHCLYGLDLSEVALATCEAALWLFVADPELKMSAVGKHLQHGDALVSSVAPLQKSLLVPECETTNAASSQPFDWALTFADPCAGRGFDLIIGNPPWVAYAGRAAQPLAPERKAYFSKHYTALRGYPTLHGLFIERATQLAPNGTIALVIPSPVADLDGYRNVRRALTKRHRVREPLLEFGQDAFANVTQPCFALIADASGSENEAEERPFKLAERQRAHNVASEIQPPEVLLSLREGPRLPPELFGEMGFQSNRMVSEHLFRRSAEPDATFSYPLLEGRDVHEFGQGPPHLFMNPDPELLRAARCRLRARDEYRRVRFVVRQTAKIPIAALHEGLPFRNSLLGGFEAEDYSRELLVGLLNSALFRALHLAWRRDARQAAFPQVKIAHLRAMPAAPAHAARRARVCELVRTMTQEGVREDLRRELDRAVFELFEIPHAQAELVSAFLKARVPELFRARTSEPEASLSPAERAAE